MQLASQQSEVFWRQRDIPLESLIENARDFLREGAYASAAATFHQALRLFPGNTDALIGLARLSEKLGNIGAALSALRKVEKRHPDNCALQFELARLEQARGRTETARGIYHRLVSRDPVDAADYRWRGLAQEKLGHPDEARAALVVAAKISPDDAESFRELGRIDVRAGRTRDGLRSLVRALELNPDDGGALAWLALAMLMQDRLEEALKSAVTAVEKAPEKAETLIALGRVQTARMAPKEAAQAFYRALAIDPRSSEAHAGLAELRLAQGRAEEAHAGFTLSAALEAGQKAPDIELDSLTAIGGHQEDLSGFMIPPGAVTASVVVISGGRIGDLDRTLESLSRQTLRHDSFEVAVVDTTPEQAGAPVAARFAENLPRLAHMPSEAPDWIGGWNTAVRHTTGSVIVVIGEGVRPAPAFLESILRPFRDPDLALAAGRVLPGFQETPGAWIGAMLRPGECGFHLGDFGCQDFGEEDFDIRPTEIPADCFAVSRLLVDRCRTPFPGSTPLDRLQYAGSGAAALLMEAEAEGAYCHYAAAATAIRRIDRKAITTDGLFRKAFRDGVVASFEDSRAGHVQPAGVTAPTSPPLEWSGPSDMPGDEILTSGRQLGYAWHQREMARDPVLRRHVLQGSYRDY
jgi:tetratricopeptide (TPR) repeat protein